MYLTKWAKLRIFWATLTSQRFSGLLWYRVTACTDVGAAHSGTFIPKFFQISKYHTVFGMQYLSSLTGVGGLKRSEIEWKI